jgi:hypothetical protein
MGQFGELFPGAKLRKESEDDAGTGEPFEIGSLDLDRGVIRLAPRPAPRPADDEEAE